MQNSTTDVIKSRERETPGADRQFAENLDEDESLFLEQEIEKKYDEILEQIKRENPFAQRLKRTKLLRLVFRCDGNLNDIRSSLIRLERKSDFMEEKRLELREILKAEKSAALTAAGLDVHSTLVIDQLEKFGGNVEKVVEVMKKRHEQKLKFHKEIEELRRRGIEVKNKKLLFQLLEQSNGDLELFEKLYRERQGTKGEIKVKNQETQNEINLDEFDRLEELRQAGIRGNPKRILKVFESCNRSIGLTKQIIEREDFRREKHAMHLIEKRIDGIEFDQCFLRLNNVDDFPEQIQRVVLHGENIFSLIPRFRQLCLDGKRDAAEKILVRILIAWKKKMNISSIDLIFESAENSGDFGDITIRLAQPTASNSETMIFEQVRQFSSAEMKSNVLIVTSDRQLAKRLKRDDFLLIKPFHWLKHCATILSSTTNFDELVDRFSTVDF